jgi:hypothetical protein
VTSAGASWVALVAATTVGLGSIQRVRAAVSADPSQLAESREGYRLIVQSYPRASLTRGELPGSGVRPIASTQRAITPQELGRGVAVDVVGIGAENDAPLIVAWVESGRADLDYDALEARPPQDAYYGVAATTESAEARAVASVVLRRRLIA